METSRGDRNTCQCLEKRNILPTCALSILTSTFPVTPVCDIFQSLIILPILHVFGGHQARPSTCIYKIFESYHGRAAIFAGPSGGNWSPRNVVLEICRCILLVQGHEVKCVDFDAIKDFRTTLPCMPEHQFIRLGANHVPSVVIWSASGNKVGIYLRISDHHCSSKGGGRTHTPYASHSV